MKNSTVLRLAPLLLATGLAVQPAQAQFNEQAAQPAQTAGFNAQQEHPERDTYTPTKQDFDAAAIHAKKGEPLPINVQPSSINTGSATINALGNGTKSGITSLYHHTLDKGDPVNGMRLLLEAVIKKHLQKTEDGKHYSVVLVLGEDAEEKALKVGDALKASLDPIVVLHVNRNTGDKKFDKELAEALDQLQFKDMKDNGISSDKDVLIYSTNGKQPATEKAPLVAYTMEDAVDKGALARGFAPPPPTPPAAAPSAVPAIKGKVKGHPTVASPN